MDDKAWSADIQTAGRAAFRAMLAVPKSQVTAYASARSVMSGLLAHPCWTPIVPAGYTESPLLLDLARSDDHRDVSDALHERLVVSA